MKGDTVEEVSKCNACGAFDSIRSNGDAGVCTECGTPEDYTYIEVEDDFSYLLESDGYTLKWKYRNRPKNEKRQKENNYETYR